MPQPVWECGVGKWCSLLSWCSLSYKQAPCSSVVLPLLQWWETSSGLSMGWVPDPAPQIEVFFLFLSVPATVVFTSVLGWKGLLLSPKGFKTFVPHKKSIWLDLSAFPSWWSFSFRPVRLRAALSGPPPSSQFFLLAPKEGLGRKIVNGSESPCICSQRFYTPMLACTWLLVIC